MLSVKSVSLQFKDKVLYDQISFSINKGEKIGLTGRNGAGKSTLMKIITGEANADGGQIDKPSNATLGYLHQDLDVPRDVTIMEEAFKAFELANSLELRLAELEAELGVREDYESDSYLELVEELSAISERLGILGIEKQEAEAEKILLGLGFKREDFDKNINLFSGGWQMRVILARMLLQRPDYLLLDEPTNHLDIESILWLEKFLKEYEGAVVLISHDRTFLDNVTKRTIEVEMGKVYDYPCNYSRYLVLREERLTQTRSAYNNQQRVIADKEKTIKRFMAKATKTKMAQSMQKQLDKIERIELEEPSLKSMKLRFPDPPRSGLVVVDAQKLTKYYGEKKILENLDLKIERGDKIAFVGQNGQGKTTLAKMVLSETDHTSGILTLGSALEIGYYAQNQSEEFNGNETLLETMHHAAPEEPEAKLRAVLGAFLFSGEAVHKKVKVLSGGERARLALACLVMKPINFLILDEPTNHLDMDSKDILKDAIEQYKGTLIVVSHDRDFLKGLTSKILEFRDHKVNMHLGDIEEYLGKRALEDMRAVEKATEAKIQQKTFSEQKPAELTDQRELKKKISSVESKIQKLEEQIVAFEKTMAAPEFYQRADADKMMDEYQSAKGIYDQLLEEWETYTVQLDN